MSTINHYFLAIPIPDKGKEALASWSKQIQALSFDYKEWVDREDFHLTLKFLGGVEEQQLKGLINEIHRQSVAFSMFSLKGETVGTFGKSHSPRVLWAGVEKENSLFYLQGEIEHLCAQQSFKREDRPYRPHITVAKKWKGGTLDLDQLPPLPEAFLDEWLVDSFHLYRIHPSKKPKYEAVQIFQLGDR